MSAKTPRFKNPPVIETVLGVHFAPLENWSIPHFGLFWQTIRDNYPGHRVQPPLSAEVETFDGPRERQARIELIRNPEVRCWFLSQDERQIVQVQNDQFICNWRKLDTDAQYPGYEEFVRPAFESNWKRFTDFLEAQSIGKCSVIQCEVTYVNHIPKEEGWADIANWSNVFRFRAIEPTSQFLPAPESGQFHLSYVLPNQKGRLRISANHAIRKPDGREVIALNLACRGKPDSSQTVDILSWLNLGREWVVRGFADITTEAMHVIWKREA